jgi:hypothetical protein
MVVKHSAKIERVCLNCGKVFYALPAEVNRGGAKYCSRKCFLNKFVSYAIEYRKTTYKHTPKSCVICGSQYKPRYDGQKCCNRECSVIYRSREKPDTRVQNICNNCGKEYYIDSWIAKRDNTKYCSKECQKMGAAGEGNPNWRGGKSFEPYCIKFTKEFRGRVRQFFEHKCVICGISESDVNYKMCVHHVTYDKSVCCNDSPRLFVTLCRGCHGKTNGNREKYEKIFYDLIHDTYGGSCYLPKT